MRDKMKCWHYRIKDDRMENGIKGIRIWHCAFAACKYILCSTPTRSNAGADLNFFCNNNNLDQEQAENFSPLGQVTADDNIRAVKFLGVFFDPALNFKHHISRLKNKLSRALYALRSVKNTINQKGLILLYTSIFH